MRRTRTWLLASAALAVLIVSPATAAKLPPALRQEPKVHVPQGPPPKHLVIETLIAGHGRRARDGMLLTVNYVGVLYKTGRLIDSSWRRHETFQFTLGAGEVIAGWDRGLVGMRVGGRRELIIPPKLAYGSVGAPPVIPRHATVIFVVDLLSAR